MTEHERAKWMLHLGSEIEKYKRAVRGLLKIAKLAMPDSYYQTDRRIRYAEKLIGKKRSNAR